MKSMMKRGIAAVLSLCMILTVFTTCIVSTYAGAVSMQGATDASLYIRFVGDDSAASGTASALGAKYDVITATKFTDTYNGGDAKPDFVVISINDSSATKADVKTLLDKVRAAHNLASIIVTNGGSSDIDYATTMSTAVSEYGGDSAKVYYCSLSDLSSFIAKKLSATISDIAKLINEINSPATTDCWLSTDYWQAVPMVNQAILDNGYTGGEGCQWPSWIEYDPVDGNYAYMGTDVGGVYRSTDGGVNWEPSSIGLNTMGAVCIAADPQNSARVILIGSSDISTGVFLSTDYGETWNRQYQTRLSRAHDYREQIAFDVTSEPLAGGGCSVVYWLRAKETDTYVQTHSLSLGLYKSTDGGVTWNYVKDTEKYASGWLEIDSNGNLYVAVDGDIYKSTDGGSTWSGKTITYLFNFNKVTVNSLCIINTDGYENNVYAMTEKGLYKSTDNGNNYTKITTSLPSATNSCSNFTYLEVSPKNPDYMVMQNDTLSKIGNYSNPNYYSKDGGKTWTESSVDKNTNVWAMYAGRQRIFTYDPTDENIILTFGGDSIYRSTDGGKNYSMSSQGYNAILIPKKCVYNVNNPNLISIASQDYNGGFSTDGGKTWKYVDWGRTSWGGGFVYGSYALSENVVVACNSTNQGEAGGTKSIVVTKDGGNTVTDTGIIVTGDLTACGAKGNNNIAFMGEWRTTDGAETWTQMTGCTGVYTCDPDKGLLFGVNAYAYDDNGTAKTYKDIVMSEDNGETWQSLYCVKTANITDIAYNSKTGKVYFAQWAYKLCSFSLDDALNGSANSTDVMTNANCGVAVDPINPDIMYTVCYSNQEHSRQNVYRSIDGGKTWTGLCRMPNDGRSGVDGANNAHACTVNPVTHELMVYTWCNGVWKISGLPSVMYDGGLTYDNLNKYVDIYNASKSVSDGVSDADITTLKEATVDALISEYETKNSITLSDSDKSSIKQLIAGMEALPLPGDKTNEAQIKSLVEQFGAASGDVQAVVKSYFDDVLPTQTAIDDVLADFIAAVDAIPAEVTADDIESITAARNSYNALGEFFQVYVPAATLEKLENAEQACKNFEGTLNVTTYGGTVLCNDRPYTAGEQYSNGTEVKLSAVPDTGYKFIAWINTSTNNIIGTDAETNVTVAGQTNIQAVFGQTGAEATQYTVVVRNKNYLVYDVYAVDKGNSITLPTPSSVGNYEFVGWKFNGSDFSSGGVITESGIIYPVYQLKESDAKYTVTVLSGTKTPAASADGKYKYNEKVTVTANEPSVGTYFAGWTKNGVIVSFDREYSFYVCNDVTVCATYSETAPQIKPQITMTDVITSTTNGKAVISFVMERTMPSDGYVYVESGLIVTVSTGKVLNLETAASDSSIKVCKSGYATPNGQLKINVITPSGHADAVGYLTYINIATGDTVTIYTDNYHGQVEIGGIESGEIEF